MGKIWADGILPECLKPYNGLYIRYLQNCHIMAVFTKGEKLCFVSHSGVPYNNDGSNSGFFIPSNIGSKSTLAIKNNKDNNINLLKGLNREFFNFIKKDIDYKSTEYKKYVAMSAACGNIDINDTLKLTSEASPVVSSLVILNTYDKRDISLKNLIVKDNDKEIKKIYNIYGHLPTGLLPTVRKNEDDGLTSYHIGLDISKAENGAGISNKLSFLYLKIAEKDDTFTGKTITKLPFDLVKKEGVTLQKYRTIENTTNTIEYQDLDIDNYFENKRVENKYITYDNVKEGTNPKDKKDVNGLYLYTIDNKIFYGMHGFILVKYEVGRVLLETDKLKPNPNEPKKTRDLVSSISSNSPNSLKGTKKLKDLVPHKIELTSSNSKVSKSLLQAPSEGGKNNKTYTKSDKRFMNGKRQMVIYLGKRGCEYVKTAGEYVSLSKFIKTINKNKK
jgi:hypothetical protein